MTTPDAPLCECCRQPIAPAAPRRDRTDAYRADGQAALQAPAPEPPYRIAPETRDALRRLFTRAPMTIGDDEVTHTKFWD
jgi:hypothetical protein